MLYLFARVEPSPHSQGSVASSGHTRCAWTFGLFSQWVPAARMPTRPNRASTQSPSVIPGPVGLFVVGYRTQNHTHIFWASLQGLAMQVIMGLLSPWCWASERRAQVFCLLRQPSLRLFGLGAFPGSRPESIKSLGRRLGRRLSESSVPILRLHVKGTCGHMSATHCGGGVRWIPGLTG